jgi:tRNA pseudouridine38-40 synthase
MSRIVLGIEYDGSAFAGWQWQKGRRSVQACVEEAVGKVADGPVAVVCAGRTDAGVHAYAQAAHFDTLAERPLRAWWMGVNRHLPDDVRVLWAQTGPEGFHARASALARHYRYIMLNRPTRSALERGRVTWVYRPLDEQAMHRAAQALVGEHDFSAFRAQGCQSHSPCRRVYLIDVFREGDRVMVDIVANAFVHHMVRNIAGALMAVGEGREQPEWIGEVLAGRDRNRAGVTASPDGLYLAGICYPEHFGLPCQPIFQRLPPDARRYT